MKFDPNNSIKIPINTLTVGMFVTAIEDSERVHLANAGRVSSEKAIKQLEKSGIKFAWVDQSLSTKGSVFNPVTDSVLDNTPRLVTTVKRQLPNRKIRQSTAAKIIRDAKELANKLLMILRS